MPLTAERLKEIQDECLADDVDVPPEATAWTDEQAYEFFESGGKTRPWRVRGQGEIIMFVAAG